MAAEPTEIRMAKLEGAYEQINVRLGAMEHRLSAEITALRTEMHTAIGDLRTDTRAEILDHRRQTTSQFFWTLTFILGSILIPILRDLAR